MIAKERFVARFLEMIRIYSPSRKEKEMADWICAYLDERNIRYVCDESGSAYGGNGRNIVAHIPGTIPGPPIGFLAHMDQVEPCQHVNAILDGDIIRTDGTTTLGADDKGGISVILEALEDLLETGDPHRELYLMFSCSEEIGMLGVKHMDRSLLPPMDIIIPDCSGKAGVIAYRAPSSEAIQVTFTGKKAHAGIEPENGINAIVAAAKAISRMRIGRLSPISTSNIGRIEGGGPTNVVTDRVSFTAEIRAHDEALLNQEIAYMEQCCLDAASEMGAKAEFHHRRSYSLLYVDPEGPFIRLIRAAMAAESIVPEYITSGGGFDGNILSSYGHTCAAVGFGMYDPHTVGETFEIEEGLKCVRIFARMMRAHP